MKAMHSLSRFNRALLSPSNLRFPTIQKSPSSSKPPAPPKNEQQRGKVPDREQLKMARVNPEVLKPFLHPDLSKEDYFGVSELVTVQEMFNARVHFGHKVGTCTENMKWALYGERLGICIFDLEITRKYLIRALNFMAHMSYSGGMFLFITTNRFVMTMVEDSAANMGHYSQVRKWEEGTLTNSRKLFRAPIRLPDMVIFLNVMTSTLNRHPAVVEAAKMAIPTIGVVDSNSEPNYITYLIPGNDDSVTSIQYYLRLFEKATKLGERKRKEHEAEGQFLAGQRRAQDNWGSYGRGGYSGRDNWGGQRSYDRGDYYGGDNRRNNFSVQRDDFRRK